MMKKLVLRHKKNKSDLPLIFSQRLKPINIELNNNNQSENSPFRTRRIFSIGKVHSEQRHSKNKNINGDNNFTYEGCKEYLYNLLSQRISTKNLNKKLIQYKSPTKAIKKQAFDYKDDFINNEFYTEANRTKGGFESRRSVFVGKLFQDLKLKYKDKEMAKVPMPNLKREKKRNIEININLSNKNNVCINKKESNEISKLKELLQKNDIQENISISKSSNMSEVNLRKIGKF